MFLVNSRYPLVCATPSRSAGKRNDFELFADICQRMTRGEHRTPAGLTEIVRRAGAMNPSGKRGYRPEVIITRLLEMKA